MDVITACGLMANKRARSRSAAAAARGMRKLGIARDHYVILSHPLGGAWVFWAEVR